MFKKLLATAATLLLGAGLSVVAVAAPASAHDLYQTPGCSSLTYYTQSFGGNTTNTVRVYIDDMTTPVVEKTFNNSIGTQAVPEVVNFDGTTAHTWKITVDAPNDTWDKLAQGVTTPCTYPAKSLTVTCTAVTGVWGQALTTNFHINMRVHTSTAPNTKLTLSAYLDQNIPGGYTGNGFNGLGVRITDTNGTQTTVPLTEQQWKSGQWVFNFPSYIKQSTSYVVEWVQFDDKHFNQDDVPGGWLDCTSKTPDATAVVSKSDASCSAASILTLGAIANAKWGEIKYSGTNNLDYTVIATADVDHIFAPGEGVSDTGKTKTFTGKLDPQKTTGCSPPEKPCLPKSQVSYTYSNNPNVNGGVITVTPLPGYSDKLCDDFYVTVNTWTFDKADNVWPQTKDKTQELHIDGVKEGGYTYGIPVLCGQGDVYASFTEQPVAPEHLLDSHNPWEPLFLHEMKFTGPGPTYTQSRPGCNVETPTVPTVQVIEKCGQYGSVIAEDTDEFDYTITGTDGQGTYTVTAAVKPGYILAKDDKGDPVTTSWSYELGTYVECVTVCETFSDGPVSTNLDPAGWVFELGDNGTYQYVDGGLKVVTTSADSAGKSAGLIPTNFPLSSAGTPTLDFTNNTGGAEPGINMVLTVDKGDGNGPQWFGTLVNEPLFTYWWINKTIPGMDPGLNPSYQKAAGTLDEFVFAFAQLGWTVNVTQVGYSLGSNAIGDNTIKSLTANCIEYTFDNLVVDPKISVEFGACYPNGDHSTKNVYVTFDNSLSDIEVTYTLGKGTPNEFVQVVAAHQKLEDVEITPVWNYGGEYEVLANGEFLQKLTLPPFDQCQEDLVPGDPKDSPEICTNGVLSQGYIWVDLIPGKLQYTIHDVTNDTDIVVTEAYTYLDAGDYIVSVVGINGFNVNLPDTWKHEITIGSPENCEVIDVPTLAEPKPILCATKEGSYLLPDVEYIDWYVEGEKVDPTTLPLTTVVTTAGIVHIEAKINTEGIYFPTDADTTWEFVFVDPTNCIEPTLTGSTAVGECSANAPFISYDVKLTDPDNQSTSRDAYLVLTDPNDATVTETIFLGTIDSSGVLTGKVLWPGASVAPDGVTATGWPGWEFVDGEWKTTTGNFAWTRDVTQAVIDVNPSLTVALEYPDATPLCDDPPELPPLATVTPTFDDSALSCTVAGTYTLGEVDPGTITWTVTGPGNPSSSIGQHAVKTPGTYTFVATPTDPADGLDPDWPYNEENPLEVVFTLPAGGCDVKTLALTGVAGIGGMTLAGGLLVIGGIAFFFLRRRTAE